MPFKKMTLIEPLLKAVRSSGYTAPTAIQERAFPHVVQGKDLLGCAQTGTGKTAAFALPILQRLHQGAMNTGGHPEIHRRRGEPADRSKEKRPIQALVLSPTRELAAQIGESFSQYGRHTGLRHTVIYGGVKQGPQCRALGRGVDILVATPGRLMDLLNQGELTLKHVEILVLDEADRMLDMGFIHDIRRVVSYIPQKRQTLLFSATMPGEIRKLADSLLQDPVTIKVAAKSAAADTVEQGVYHLAGRSKGKLLEHLLRDPDMARTLVFSRTKRGADRIVKRLNLAGVAAAAIHSDKTQATRTRALDNFKRGALRVLVASDIAARGIDVDQISHVINYDMPNDPETYVHRIGRTGRAGAEGRAISFCSDEERGILRDVERMLRKPITVLSCSIAPKPTGLGAKGASHAVHPMAKASGGTPGGGSSRRRQGSPEQQKSSFWRAARKKRQDGRRPATGKSTGPRRRG